jgi:plasmid stability protein
MPSITVKNIPDALFENLKNAAQAHHRSMNSEIIACLEKELMLEKVSPLERINTAQLLRERFKGDLIAAEEITEYKNKGRP